MVVVKIYYHKYFHFDKISGWSFFLEIGHLSRFHLWFKLKLWCLKPNVINNVVVRFSNSHRDFQLIYLSLLHIQS